MEAVISKYISLYPVDKEGLEAIKKGILEYGPNIDRDDVIEVISDIYLEFGTINEKNANYRIRCTAFIQELVRSLGLGSF